jgi:hypothetical protein
MFAIALAAAVVVAAEPSPRTLKSAPFKGPAGVKHITAVRELRGGALLISDVTNSSLLKLDPATGAASPVGSAGPGDNQYAEPGGFYGGANGTILLADHSGPRALVLSPDGTITGGYRTARRGVRSSSDSDTDQTRLDARGFAYFADRASGLAITDLPTSSDLVRLDPAKQTEERIAQLAIPKSERLPSGDGMILTRSVIGDPADGWGVLPDGRVAVVRANPYRVEWISPAGSVTKGPVIAYDPLPYTEQDREAVISRLSKSGAVGVGVAGGANSASPQMTRKFAVNKPPFFPDDILVSPAGRVWVMRTQPFGATTVIYDVFDTTGARVDRVALPADSRVVGFGAGAVYVREGAAQLRKYSVQ